MPNVRFMSFVLFLAMASPLRGQATAGRLDAYLSARAKLGQFNGSVLVARNGRVLLDKGYGWANVEHRVKAGPETRYAIASITKNFTAAAILRLREAGTLTLGDSPCRWIDSCPDAWRAVTLEQMLHHPSGIPDYEEPLDLGSEAYVNFMSQSHSAARIVEQARAKPLDFPPGTSFRYSNTAYIVLGYVIEKASGVPYEEFLRTHVLEPAGVATMRFASGTVITPHLASGYRIDEMDFATVQRGIALDEHTMKKEAWLPLDGPHGDAKLVATAHELWQWMQALSDSTALAPASIGTMFTPGLGGYGTGWFIDQRFGKRTLTHTGLLPGYASIIEWYPDSRTAIILLSNTTGLRNSMTLDALAAIVFGKPYDLPVARRLTAYDSSAAVPLTGEYALADGRVAIVKAEHDMLLVEIPGRFTAGAFPVGASDYYAPFFDNMVRFARGSDGRARTIALRINGATLSGVRK